MDKISSSCNFRFTRLYYRQKELALLFGISPRTLDRWIAEEGSKGRGIPGRMKLKGSRSYIWDPMPFHQWLIEEKLCSPVGNEHALAENKAIMANLEKKRINPESSQNQKHL